MVQLVVSLIRRSRRRGLLLFSHSYVPRYHCMLKLAVCGLLLLLTPNLIIISCFHGIQVLLILMLWLLLGSINEIYDILDQVIITIKRIFFELV